MSSDTPSAPVVLTRYTDLLCVWAYLSQVRVDELRRHFGEKLVIRSRFCSVFADTEAKLAKSWRDRGGLPGYRAHVEHLMEKFDHVTLHADVWTRTIPLTSATPHAFVKAAELVEEARGGGASLATELAWRLRLAFFRDGLDISQRAVQCAVAESIGLVPAELEARLSDGSAWARLFRDYDDAAAEHIRGSPSFVLNEGRQLLYGNVGYKILEANVNELFRDAGDQASWC